MSLIVQAGCAASNGEAKRLIQQGGVSIDGDKVTDIQLQVQTKKSITLKVGKRNFKKVQFKSK